MPKKTLTLLKESHVVWNWNYDQKLCIPFFWPIGEQCVDITGGVSILEADGTFTLEVAFMGVDCSFQLATGCIPTVSVGLAHLNVCVEPEMDHGKLVAFRIEIKVCLGIYGVEKCWTLFDQRIGVGLVGDLPKELLAKAPAGRMPKYYAVAM